MSLGRPQLGVMARHKRNVIESLLERLGTQQAERQPEMTDTNAGILMATYLHMSMWSKAELGAPVADARRGGGGLHHPLESESVCVSRPSSSSGTSRGGAQAPRDPHGGTPCSTSSVTYVRAARLPSDDAGSPERGGVTYSRDKGTQPPHVSTASLESRSGASDGESSYTSGRTSVTSAAPTACVITGSEGGAQSERVATAQSPPQDPDAGTADTEAAVARFLMTQMNPHSSLRWEIRRQL